MDWGIALYGFIAFAIIGVILISLTIKVVRLILFVLVISSLGLAYYAYVKKDDNQIISNAKKVERKANEVFEKSKDIKDGLVDKISDDNKSKIEKTADSANEMLENLADKGLDYVKKFKESSEESK